MTRYSLALLLWLPAALSWAADEAAELPFKYDKLVSSYDLAADGAAVENHTLVRTVLRKAAVERMKEGSFSYSVSIQKGEMLEAYTLKANGRRIEVPRQNYQLNVASGKDNKSPFFSDRSEISVVFPDVDVGDKVVMSYRITEKAPMFPGQFSEAFSFSPYYQYDDARITIRTPLSMKLSTAAFHVEEKSPVVENGMRVYRWNYRNLQPTIWNAAEQGIDRPQDLPGVFVSTFSSFQQLAEAYGVRARPKAAVTERIRTVAAAIVGDKKSPDDKAKAIYDWVAQNITYGGNCIGIGAVVPRDLDVVLDNRMGDCKDHATLLQALLAASDIKSTQVLINAGELYELPPVPVVSSVNHVINYLPVQNLYLDSTSSSTPYGMLPFSDSDKPVLHVDGFSAGTRTPVNNGAQDVQYVKTRVQLSADGSAQGDIDVRMQGRYGMQARSWFKELPPSRRAQLMKRGLQDHDLTGDGEIVLPEIKGLASDYRYSATFKVSDYLKNTEAGVLPVYPVLWTPASTYSFIDTDFSEPPKKASSCIGGHTVEDFEISLPPAMKILYLPKDRSVAGAGLAFSSHYSLTGNTLTLTRKIDDVVPSNLCTKDFLIEREKIQRQLQQDLRSLVLYQIGS